VIDEMPPELRELISAEQSAPIAGDAVRTAIHAKVGGTLGIAAAVAKTAFALKLVTIVIGVVSVGGMIAALRGHDERSNDSIEIAAAHSTIEEARAEPASLVVNEPVPVSTSPAQNTTRPPTRVVRSQVELLRDATRFLSQDPHRALRLLAEDARDHPDGSLAEEREALRLQALLALGRTTEAREAARSFRMTYPHTIHQTLVARALAEEAL
jgi:hypothetical protein